MIQSTDPFAPRKARWRNFYDLSNPQRFVFIIRYGPGAQGRPRPRGDNLPERIDWAVKQYETMLERAQWLDDDLVPYVEPYTGTEIFAEAFGCTVHCPEDSNPHALPLVGSAGEAARLVEPSLDTPAMARLFEIGDALRSRCGDDAVMRLVDIQSPMDVAALIWEKTDFYVAMLTDPAAVKDLAGKVFRLQTAFLDEWFGRYGTDFVAHYPDYYMPGGITLSEDEIGVVSEQVYRDMFAPELAELARRYGSIGIHCCADSVHQWPALKEVPNLKLLNLVRPPEQAREAYPTFADTCAQMHNWCGEGSVDQWFEAFGPEAHVVIHKPAETKDEAMELAEVLRKRCAVG